MWKTLKYSIVDSKYTWNSLTAKESTKFLRAMIVPHRRYWISCWSQMSLKVFWLEISTFLSLNILSKYNIVSLENLILFSDPRVHKLIHNLNKKKDFFLSSTLSKWTEPPDLNIPLQGTAFAQSAFSFTAIKHRNYGSSWAQKRHR